MKIVKRIVLILLLLTLLSGALLLHPIIRFTGYLRLGRAQEAEAVYLSRLQGSDLLDREARRQLQRYAQALLDGYDAEEIPYGQAMDALTPLSLADLPQEDIARCMEDVERMEQARVDLAHANACYSGGDYARAIPLYRQAQQADATAAYRLKQAEALYKDQTLDAAEAAMDADQYDAAESALREGLAVLGSDEDLTAALQDVERMQADEAAATLIADIRGRLREDADDAFRYVAMLRQHAPEEYAFAYLEQLLRHDYEEDICAQAQSLLSQGESDAAVALLEEGLSRLDSDRMAALLSELKTVTPVWLVDMPLLRDETADPRSGAESTVARDQVLRDAANNGYDHSFSADTGSVTFDLEGAFAQFTGTVAFPAGETSDIYRSAATLRLYADGRPLAEFKNVDSGSAPLPFSLPLSGVYALTMEWTSDGANGWKDWGRFATVFDGQLLSSPR